MVVHVVAYQAITQLLEEIYMLKEALFHHFPIKTEMNGVYDLCMVTPRYSLCTRMTEFVNSQSLMI